MTQRLCITVRYLQGLSHARGDGGEPEWPPSPLRLYQALVAAAAGRWNERTKVETAAPALEWLARLDAPTIVAPVGVAGAPCRFYVPDNGGDKVGASWSRGNEGSIADYRTEKDVRPVHLRGEAVHYLYSGDGPELPKHRDILRAAARGITHLGWGADMVVGNSEVLSEADSNSLAGERWSPEPTARQGLRVPVGGTLAALATKHEAFLSRLGEDGFRPVPPLTAFRVMGYRRSVDPAPRAYAAFNILQLDASGYRPFETARRTRDVAGMARHAVALAAARNGWSKEHINEFVHGKSRDGSQPARGADSPDRFAYVPLPTINATLRRVESVRRFLVAAPSSCTDEISWVQRALSGEDLTDDAGVPAALATILPKSDWVLRQYVEEATAWATVTPVILPRHQGYDDVEAGDCLREAFEHAGYSRELLAQTEIDWQRVGFWRGADLASRYLPPENLAHKPRYHVRVKFPHPIRGPIVIGAGRYRGFGLFAKFG